MTRTILFGKRALLTIFTCCFTMATPHPAFSEPSPGADAPHNSLANPASRADAAQAVGHYLCGQADNRAYDLTDASKIAVDWANGYFQTVTLGGNRTFTFTGGKPGGRYILAITQDATGSRTMTLPASLRWPGAHAPPLTAAAGRTDYFGLLFNGKSSTYDIMFIAQNY